MKTLFIFPLLFFFLLIFPQKVWASSVSFSSSQTSLAIDEEFVVDAQVSVNASDGTIYYLRGQFYRSDGSYCGYTWNGNNWYNGPYTSGDGWKNLLQITMNNDSWSGQLKAKPDYNELSCSTSGNYSFRIQRYTSTGNPSTDSMSPLTVSIAVPTPTPSPSPSPSPTPTQTSTSTPTTIPTATPIKTSTPKPSPTKTPSPKPSSSPEVLGKNTSEPTIEPSPEVEEKTSNKKKFPFLPVILIGSGLSMVGLAVLQLINAAKKSKKDSPLAPPDNMGGSNI